MSGRRTAGPNSIEPSHAEGDAAPAQPGALGAFLPADLLQPGEVVILFLKPSVWFILVVPLRPLVIITLMAAVGLLLSARVDLPIARRDIVLLAILIGGVRLFWQFLEWLGRIYVLTDRRVIRVRGVARVHVFEASLKKITNTSMEASLRERLLGLGSIGFATAGTGPHEVRWQMIARPREVHRIVVQTLERYR